MAKNFLKFFASFLFVGLFVATICDGANYQLLDSALAPGGYSASSNFTLNGAISQISIGASTASNFKINAGLLYFPLITTPVVTATAGDTQATLSWTVAEGVLGWSAGSYLIGQSTTAGGPYTDSSVGLLTSSTRTSLTNGTTYYFVIKVKDALGNVIATSTEVSVTPVTATTPPGGGSGSGGGGGGGGGSGSPTPIGTGVVFRGRAYPLSSITLLKDGILAATTKAGPDASFEITLSNLNAGSFNFSVYATDNLGNQSVAQTFPITLTTNVSSLVSGIFIAPSIATDKSEVRRGDNIAIFGRSAPLANVVIAVNSEKEIFAKAPTDKDGAYLYNLDSVELEMGNHTAKSKASKDIAVSPFGSSIGFKVGTQNIASVNNFKSDIKPKTCPAKGDLNGDCKVNLVDFSIAAYWYKRTLTGAIIQIEKDKINGDGKINLTDFSIIAYYWSG